MHLLFVSLFTISTIPIIMYSLEVAGLAVPLCNSSQLHCFFLILCTAASRHEHSFFMLNSCSVTVWAIYSCLCYTVTFMLYSYHIPIQLLCCSRLHSCYMLFCLVQSSYMTGFWKISLNVTFYNSNIYNQNEEW